MPKQKHEPTETGKEAKKWGKVQNREYYLKNKERILSDRRKKYAEDEEYRERLKKKRTEYYKEKRIGRLSRKRGRKGRNNPRLYCTPSGRMLLLYGIGPLGRVLKRHHSVVRNWYKASIIPAIEDKEGGLWFQEEVLNECKIVMATMYGKCRTKRAETAVLRPYLKKELRKYYGRENKEEKISRGTKGTAGKKRSRTTKAPEAVRKI